VHKTGFIRLGLPKIKTYSDLDPVLITTRLCRTNNSNPYSFVLYVLYLIYVLNYIIYKINFFVYIKLSNNFPYHHGKLRNFRVFIRIVKSAVLFFFFLPFLFFFLKKKGTFKMRAEKKGHFLQLTKIIPDNTQYQPFFYSIT
jgi:hypothetical protein